MVSTRGPRYKFSEGERVLCYEPDPTKAKVLYDSKVLEVIENKDRRGRRNVEYLIHFQGWNSSWDRCVSEDFVLKDTEENRQLQRDLAEKSQLQLGAYLYRRERKKGGSSAPGGPKRPRVVGFSDEGSSSSTQNEGEGDTVESDSSSTSRSQSPPPSSSSRANITLPTQLRDRLTFDYHLVMKRGKLSRLPASPCAAEILESFVKWFARAGAWHPPRNRQDPPQKPDLHDVSCRKGQPYDLRDKSQKDLTEEEKMSLNLVREIADGLRVYFDFVLRGHLLYKQEHAQYYEICGKFLEQFGDVDLKSIFGLDDTLAAAEKEIKSPKVPEYSHLPPDPDAEKNGGTAVSGSTPRPPASQDPPPPPPPEEPATPDDHATPLKFKDTKTPQRPGAVARRLRSHKSVVSELEEPAASTSVGEPRPFETLSSSVGSSGSSVSEPWARPATSATTPTTTRTPLSLLLDKVSKWEIIPREGTEHLPCRIYGAIHLARLFVKLPEFLSATSMPDYKLKLILKHIDMFIQYLDEHSEWFGESYYTADPTAARAH